MRQEIRETTKEVVNKKVVYIANDGTEFDDMTECIRWENSAKGMLFRKMRELALTKELDDPMDGCDEAYYDTVLPQCQGDIDTLNHLDSLFHSCSRDVEGRIKESRFTCNDIGNPIFVGYRWEGNEVEYLWFYKISEIIEKYTNNTFKLVKKV